MEQWHRPTTFRLVAWIFVGTIASWVTTPCESAEDGEAFVAALRDRNLHDLALDYLQLRGSSPLVDEAFRARIPYEQANLLLAKAERTVDTSARAGLLKQAQDKLAEYAATNQNSDVGGESRLRLAQVLLERGRQDVLRAEGLGDEESNQRDALLESARATFDEAKSQFAEAQEYYNNARKQFPTNLDPRTEADKIALRDEYRLQWLTAWFYNARTNVEKAKAYPAESAEFKRLNEEAARELADLYEKYHTRLVGLTSHLYEGQAYQAMGQLDKAIATYEDLVIQPDGAPEFRLLITQATTGLAECLLQQEKLDEVIARCGAWIANSTPHELLRPEWLAVRFHVASAKKAKCATLEEHSREWNRLRREAREEFKQIAREASPYRRKAQQEFALLTNREADELAASEIQGFEEAMELATDAFEEMRAFAAQAAAVEDVDQAADMNDASQESGQRAQAYFQRALALAPGTDELDLDELNMARYYLAWLNYQDEDYRRAALVGEFLARKYPDSPPARDGAKIALGAYQQLYRAARGEGAAADEVDAEAGRIADMANYVVRRWPGTEDAALAQDTLVSFAVREGRLDDAKALLENVDPQRRLQSELRVAGGLWVEFLTARREEGTEEAMSQATANLRDEAHRRLEAAFREAGEGDDVSTLAATAGLYLAQSHLLADDYAAATVVLEAEKLGPLTLARANHAAASQPEFLVEVYKTALQAFSLALPPQQDKAAETMALLDGLLANQPDAAQQLSRIYLGLGVQLHERLERLSDTGQQQAAEEVAAAFAGVLDRLASGAGNDWTTQLWTAQTFYEVAEAIATPGRSSSLAASYFEKSLAAFDRLLTAAQSDPAFAPSDRAVLAVRKRKADVLRGMQRYSEAMDIYTALLGENEMMLDVQRDAAYTYQLWGEQDARRFENAIHGGRRVKSTGENRIWGWAKLARVAAAAARQNPQYRDWYFEAWLQAAQTRYRSAAAVEGDERTKRLNSAKNPIRALFQTSPELGGPDRRQEFEDLLMKIQTALKERPAGLQEFAVTSNQ